MFRSMCNVLLLDEWLVVVAAVFYFLSPLDVIPDSLGPLGYLDDVLILALAHRYVKGAIRLGTRVFNSMASAPRQLHRVYGEDDVCALCLGEHPLAATLNPCGHRYCGHCAGELHRRGMCCALCRNRIGQVDYD
jgi:hypothetical protein